MSQENVEAHNRAIEALNRRNIEAMLENFDSEVEWHPATQASFGGEPVYRGHEGVRALFRDFYAAFAELHIEPSEVRDLGDRTLAIGRMRARGGGSGAETESSWGSLAEYRNGKAVRIWTFLDREEALEAAGLSE
jgi:ketosteroid isomerase-like protein